MKGLFVSTLAVMTMISPAFAGSSDLCESLWVQRNVYYKDAGYCFKTSRAIRYFGNAGCLYDAERAVPLSRSIRNLITDIGRVERQLACGDWPPARRVRGHSCCHRACGARPQGSPERAARACTPPSVRALPHHHDNNTGYTMVSRQRGPYPLLPASKESSSGRYSKCIVS
jgi:hypothetical protein